MPSADASRKVKIEISVIGNAVKKLEGIAKGLTTLVKPLDNIAKNINGVSSGMTELGTALGVVKANVPDLAKLSKDIKSLVSKSSSKNLADLITSLSAFNTIKPSTNLASLVTSIQAFSNLKKPPNLTTFVSSLQVLAGVRGLPAAQLSKTAAALLQFKEVNTGLPQKKLVTFAEALLKLREVKGVRSANLVKIADALSKFKDLSSLPTGDKLKKFADGLKALKGGVSTKNAQSLETIGKALKGFVGLKSLPDLEKFGKSLLALSKINVPNFTKLSTEVRKLSSSMASLAQVTPNMNKELEKVSKKSKQTSVSVKEMGDSTKKAASQFGELRRRVENYASYRLVADSIIYLKEAFTAGIDEIIDYDQALKDLQAITSATESEIRIMGDTILSVASSTKFSAKEVAEGMRTLGQTGLSASEAIEAMQGVSDLATGTLSDMGSAVDLVTSAMRVYSDTGLKAATAADVFANAVNKSKLTIDKIRTAFNYVAPIAKSANVSFQDMSAAMGVLANSGLKASKIGTGLRRVLAELVDPNEKLAAAAEEVGISLSQLNPEGKDLQSVFEALGIVVHNTQKAFDIFGKRGAAAVLTLTEKSDDIGRMRETVSKSGTAAAMAAVQMEGLGVAFKNLRDKLGVLMVALGKAGIIGVMKSFVNVTRQAVVALTEFASGPIGGAILKIGLFAAAVATLITTISIISGGMKALVVVYLAATSATVADTVATGLNTKAKLRNAKARGSAAVAAGAEAAAAGASAAAQSLGLGKVGKVAGRLVGVMGKVGRAIVAATNPVTLFIAAWGGLGLWVMGQEKSAEELEAAFARTQEGIDKSITKVGEYKDKLFELENSEEDIVKIEKDHLELVYALAANYPKYTEEILAAKDSNVELFDILEKIQKAEKKRKFTEMKKGLSDITEATAKYKLSLDNVDSGFLKWKRKEEGQGKVLLENAKKLDKVDENVQGLAKSYLELKEAGEVVDFAEFWDEANDVSKDYYKTVERLKEPVRKAYEELLKLKDVAGDKVSLGLFTEWGRELKKGSDKFVNGLKDLGKTIEGASDNIKGPLSKVFDADTIGVMQSLQAQKAALVEKKRLNNEEIAEYEKSGKLKDAADRKYYQQLIANKEILNGELLDLNKKFDSNYELQAAIKLAQAQSWYDKEKKLLDKKLAKDLISEQQHIQKLSLLKKKFGGQKEEAIGILFDPERILAEVEKSVIDLDATYSKLYDNLDLKVHDNLMSETDALNEKTKLSAEKAREVLAIWEKAYNEISILSTDSKEAEKAYEGRINAEKKLSKVVIANVIKTENKIIKVIKKAEEAISKAKIKTIDAVKKFSDKADNARLASAKKFKNKKIALEATLAAKILAIADKLNAKLEKLDEDRLKATKDRNNSIIDHDMSLADKLHKIRQKGMSDEQKIQDNRRTANSKYLQGIRLINRARKSGDEATFKRGEKLLDQASSLYEGDDNVQIALAGVQKVSNAQRKAIEVKHRMEQDAINAEQAKQEELSREAEVKAETKFKKDLKRAKTLLGTELTGIDTKLAVSLKAEKIRHAAVMRDLEIEIAKQGELLKKAKEIRPEIMEDGTPKKKDPKSTGTEEIDRVNISKIEREAKAASKAVDELGESLYMTRKESETDVEFSLRINEDGAINDEVERLQIEMRSVGTEADGASEKIKSMSVIKLPTAQIDKLAARLKVIRKEGETDIELSIRVRNAVLAKSEINEIEKGVSDIDKAAGGALGDLDKLGKELNMVREEAETDMEFALRISNAKEVNTFIKKLKEPIVIDTTVTMTNSPTVPFSEGIKKMKEQLLSISKLKIKPDVSIKALLDLKEAYEDIGTIKGSGVNIVGQEELERANELLGTSIKITAELIRINAQYEARKKLLAESSQVEEDPTSIEDKVRIDNKRATEAVKELKAELTTIGTVKGDARIFTPEETKRAHEIKELITKIVEQRKNAIEAAKEEVAERNAVPIDTHTIEGKVLFDNKRAKEAIKELNEELATIGIKDGNARIFTPEETKRAHEIKDLIKQIVDQRENAIKVAKDEIAIRDSGEVGTTTESAFEEDNKRAAEAIKELKVELQSMRDANKGNSIFTSEELERASRIKWLMLDIAKNRREAAGIKEIVPETPSDETLSDEIKFEEDNKRAAEAIKELKVELQSMRDANKGSPIFTSEELERISRIKWLIADIEENRRKAAEVPTVGALSEEGKDIDYGNAPAFNTVLSDEDQKHFEVWLKEASKEFGRDITRDFENYDIAGFWKDRVSQGLEEGIEAGMHSPDTYKKPNHPTFSDESKYSTDEFQGGTWDESTGEKDVFTPSQDQLDAGWDPAAMQEYFDSIDAGVTVSIKKFSNMKEAMDENLSMDINDEEFERKAHEKIVAAVAKLKASGDLNMPMEYEIPDDFPHPDNAPKSPTPDPDDDIGGELPYEVTPVVEGKLDKKDLFNDPEEFDIVVTPIIDKTDPDLTMGGELPYEVTPIVEEKLDKKDLFNDDGEGFEDLFNDDLEGYVIPTSLEELSDAEVNAIIAEAGIGLAAREAEADARAIEEAAVRAEAASARAREAVDREKDLFNDEEEGFDTKDLFNDDMEGYDIPVNINTEDVIEQLKNVQGIMNTYELLLPLVPGIKLSPVVPFSEGVEKIRAALLGIGEVPVTLAVDKEKIRNITNAVIEPLPLTIDTEGVVQQMENVKGMFDNYKLPLIMVPGIKMSPIVPFTEGIENIKAALLGITELELKVGIKVESSTIEGLEDQEIVVKPKVEETSTWQVFMQMFREFTRKTPHVVSITASAILTEWESAKVLYDYIKDKVVTITTRHVVEGGGSSEGAEEKAEGGPVQGLARGGFPRLIKPMITKGSGFKDDVKALLMKGEYVLKQSAVTQIIKQVGPAFLNKLNRGIIDTDAVPNFALGGLVGINDDTLSGLARAMGGISPANLATASSSATSNSNVVNTSSWSVNIGSGAFAPRGNVQSKAQSLMDEVTKRY